ANVYRGDCSALGLVATSAPPAIAGVQLEVIDVLLRHGARMDLDGSAGNRQSLIHACLANGQPEAADHLVRCGAPLDFIGAAGVGRLDMVKALFPENFEPTTGMRDAFAMACGYGKTAVVEFFLDRGMDPNAELRLHGEGHTGLHVAAFHAHVEVVD